MSLLIDERVALAETTNFPGQPVYDEAAREIDRQICREHMARFFGMFGQMPSTINPADETGAAIEELTFEDSLARATEAASRLAQPA